MKIGFLSLGCPKNLVDSEVMLGLLRGAGHELTANPAEAEVLVVNTCAFIDAAKQESIDAVLEMAQFKERGACKQLIVTGCLAERYRDEIQNEIPEVDAVLGTGEVPFIVDAVDGATNQIIPVTSVRRPIREASRPLPTYIYDADTPRLRTTPSHFAYVKVAEGCDYACAFCIIPKLRGHYRSRSADSIVNEAAQLAATGVRELILISQDTTFYGVDRDERGALGRLLRRLNTVAGLSWIRLLYLYPTTIGNETLDAMAECERVCRYIDLPLQHASDTVLRRMKRPGSGQHYRRLIDRIRQRVPGVALRTTFIVGFPGEREADFEQLCGFVRNVGFDHVGVFTYSHEEGTTAHSLADDVPERVKQERQRTLMNVQKELVKRANRLRLHQAVTVMIDGPAAEHELVWRGRLEGQAPDIDSCVYMTELDTTSVRPGDLIECIVVDSRGHDLLARPADRYASPPLAMSRVSPAVVVSRLI